MLVPKGATMSDNADPTSEQPSESHAGHIPITEEMDSAKWTLPPLMTVLGAGAVLAIVFAIVIFSTSTPPAVAISITKVATADMQDNVMVAVQVKIDNQNKTALQIKNIEAELEAADGKKYPDHAASASEAARYLQAFASLADAKAEPLREELTIPSKTSYTGVSIFAYPVAKTVFFQRKSALLSHHRRLPDRYRPNERQDRRTNSAVAYFRPENA